MKTSFYVKGTTCPSCKALIEEVISEIEGIVSCTVDYKTGKVEIEHKKQLDVSKIKKEIESLGNYKVNL